MHPRWPVASRARALPAAECLVKGPSRAAEGDVVHRALSLRGDVDSRVAERGEDGVGDALRHFDVARCHGRRPRRVDGAARGKRELDGARDAVVRGHIIVEQRPHREHGRGARHGGGTVHVARDLWRAAGEVEMQRTVAHRECNLHGNIRIRDAITLQPVDGTTVSSLQRREPRANPAFGIPEQRITRRVELRRAEARGERAPACRTCRTRRQLRAEIPATLRWRAHVGENETEQLVVERSGAHEAHRWHDQSLLHELRRALRHAAGAHAADVGVMCADSGESAERSVDLHRLHQREIREMRPAVIRIVEQKHIAGLWIARAHRGDCLGHCAEVHGDVRGLRDHAARGVEQRGRRVAALSNVRRQRAAHEHRAHLFGDHGNGVREHRELERIDRLACRHAGDSPCVSSHPPESCATPVHPGAMRRVAPGSAMTDGPAAIPSGVEGSASSGRPNRTGCAGPLTT